MKRPSTTVRRFATPTQVPVVSLGRGIDTLDITFAGAVPDPATVKLGTSITVEDSGGNAVGGALHWQADNVLRFIAEPAFPPNNYVVTLTDAIVSLPDAAGNVARFDGEPGANWPSGDDNPGGDLVIRFTISP